jgi:hypothetical protein
MIFCLHQTVNILVLHLAEAKCRLPAVAAVGLRLFESIDGVEVREERRIILYLVNT